MRISGWSVVIRGVMALMVVNCGLEVSAQAQAFTTLANFNGGNGKAPAYGPMIQGTDGNYYGATQGGGKNDEGAIFQVTSAGELRDSYSFCSLANCADGWDVWMMPILGNDGNFYGTTNVGGNNINSGTFYKMSIGGKLTTLYNFGGTAGQYPAGITQASSGNFYGATSAGGQFTGGTVFELTPAGELKVLYNFCAAEDCHDGGLPLSAPVQASNGNFYGTTFEGGIFSGGVLYGITPAGSYKVIHNFCSRPNCIDGLQPWSPPVQDAAGNLYGTTQRGGAYNEGTIYEITATGRFTVLHSFDYTDGANPESALILANDGNLYGTTSGGGTANGGTIFQINRQGAYTSLYNFCNTEACTTYQPVQTLLQGTDGILYGATYQGGTDDMGTVFSLNNGLSPLVETVPVAGTVGQSVIILGNNLTGSTSVTFNGVPAAFTVESDTCIKASVPPGATTGAVSVVTPAGTLKSNPVFQVLK
jgi:uncharacterized repeat protein (TIGR03803 family)